MKTSSRITAALGCIAATMLCTARGVPAQTASDLVRETLRQQSAAERSSCAGVQRTIAAGTDATVVVRTAVELGYNACQVIRCALEGTTGRDRDSRCEKVVRGAIAAGVQPDVISRCSADACDPAAVAALFAATLLEPDYCYFYPLPLAAPAPPPPAEPVFDRSTPPQISPFTF